MAVFELSREYILAIFYFDFLSSLMSLILIILLVFSQYILIKNNYNYKKMLMNYFLLLLVTMGLRMAVEVQTGSINLGGIIPKNKCELFEKGWECPRCEITILTPILLFWNYFLIVNFFNINLYEINNAVKILKIEYNNLVIYFISIFSLSPLFCMSFLLYKILNLYDYFSIKLVLFNGLDICRFNQQALEDYNNLTKFNTPIIFINIILVAVLYSFLSFRIIKISKVKRINTNIINNVIKNINLSFTYILIIFLNVIIPQYILDQLPLSGLEYIMTMFVLCLYLDDIKLFDDLYIKIYKCIIIVLQNKISSKLNVDIYSMAEKREIDVIIEETEETHTNTNLSSIKENQNIEISDYNI